MKGRYYFMEHDIFIYLTFILCLSVFLGFEVISKVPSTLHTPLMSATNAIHGITLVGAIVSAGLSENIYLLILSGLAIAFAAVNVVGGFVVTDRMLEMFKKKR